MSCHRLIPRIGRITRKLACVKDTDECIRETLVHSSFRKSLCYALAGELCRRHIQFIRYESEQSLVQFLIKRGIQVLLEEGSCKTEAFEGHLCSLAVLCSCNIRPSCSYLSEYEPAGRRQHQKKYRYKAECRRAYKEASFGLEVRFLDIDEPYVAREILHILAGNSGHDHRSGFCLITFLYRKGQRLCLKSHILFPVNIVVGVFYGFYDKFPVAARNERKLVCLAAGESAFVNPVRGLGIIYLHIGRERHLRSLKQRHISLSCHCHHKRAGLMGLKDILGQAGRYIEISHTACK